MPPADQQAAALNADTTLWAVVKQPPTLRDIEVILTPLSRPELGDIRIDASVFAIGRAEPPFCAFGADVCDALSRRHARIFREGGFVYLADLQSRNGTTLNGVGVLQTPCQLRDADEICFGGALSYRVRIVSCTRAASALTLTLTPKSGTLGLETIIVKEFPFLVSKSDATFSRYADNALHTKQLSYLSRRHAYIFEKNGKAYVEDLGSVNGTKVNGKRCESAVALEHGDVVAFGGKHFAYRVGLSGAAEDEAPPVSARVRWVGRQSLAGRERVSAIEEKPAALRVEREPSVVPVVDNGGTRFMAAATSFLDIFCADEPPKAELQPGNEGAALAAKEVAVKRRPRSRALILLSEIGALLSEGDAIDVRRMRRWAAAAAGVVVALACGFYFWGAAERDLKNALTGGDYSRAASLAGPLLAQHPDDVALKAQATEAALKANVPLWLADVQGRDFDAARKVLGGMSDIAMHDPELQPLIEELGWLGNLERAISVRGGPAMPIRIYADEDTIEKLIARWSDDTGEHQRALTRIAASVPQFGDWYGEALTHVRKLQSDAAVYLPVIERLKDRIATEVDRDDAEGLVPVLTEASEKYPGLGGLDRVRQELASYLELQAEARAGRPGRLFAHLRRAHFMTPPFAQSVRALMASGQLPGENLLRQYDAATTAWQTGDAPQSLAMLQTMTSGPWGDQAAVELERRRDVSARFAALQDSRGAAGHVNDQLAFQQTLDPDEDSFYVRAAWADLKTQPSEVIARAQQSLNHARALWEKYKSVGAIDASQRIETSISERYRSRARLLAEASRDARQGLWLFSQIDPAGAKPWAAICAEIDAEAVLQRNSLRDLSNVIEPELLGQKLALLDEVNP